MPAASRASNVALLRGINVGGARKIVMTELARVFELAGCRAVQTYIQSGNVVFEAKGTPAALQSRLEACLAESFGFEIPVVIRSREALERCARANPFLSERGIDEGHLHIAFMARDPGVDRLAKLDADRSPPDSFRAVGGDVYLHLPNGVARSKLTNAYFDARLGTVSTMRNFRTVLKLLELLQGG
jgi:uncharacterized protein (DUF1697 family)